MITAVIGAAGQLGTDLLKLLPGDVVPIRHSDMELTNPDSIAGCLDRIQPEFVINSAAYNLVDRAEDEIEQAFSVNAFGPARLARWCLQHQATLVHFSTDYVFGRHPTTIPESGDLVPKLETDAAFPESVYAASKHSGENLVQAICPRHFVIRTCGLYGVAATQGAGKGNFVETMLRLGRERDELAIVNDQHCTPTATRDLAQATVELIQTRNFGLYHATNSGETTWYDLALEIFRQDNIDVRVRPVSTTEFGAKAARPAYSVMNCQKLEAAIGRPMPSWQQALSQYLIDRTKTAD
ncbi:MAG: dTDP-4-dehydrorhamnose reductase [Planctomycetota bacterium]|nr:dTDP-4-dehydrorhamnose reductase [Planctomycetota bacterium]